VKFKQETDFQETEIGKIPREWKVVKLKDIGKIVSGFTFSLELQGKNSGKYPFIKVNDMNNSYKYIYTAENYVDDNDLVKLKARPYPPNTIIFPKIGMAVRLNKYRILRLEALFDNNIAGVIINDKLAYYEFIYYYLQGKIDLMSLASMTTVPSITKTKLENIPIPYPSIHEQRRIAEILSTVDRVIEGVDVAVARLESLKKALMRELLTGRIRVREENGKLIFNKETDFQDTEIGKIPREWGLAKLEEMAKIITGPFGSQLKKSELTNHGIKVYTQENVLERNFEIGNLYISEEKFKELKNFEVIPDDVLLTIRGTIGKSIKVPTGITKGIIHTNLAIIRLEKKEVLPDFVELVFNESEILMEQVRRIHTATTLPALYGRTLKQIKIMLPPLNEQKVVIGISSIIDRAIGLYRGERVSLERLKRGLMNLLLTGRVRVVRED
jgi:type I restriction enzyme S subunit